MSLVCSVLKYGPIVRDPYYVKDTDRLEKIQHQVAHLISGDFATCEPGCISKMLKDQGLPSRVSTGLFFFLSLPLSPDRYFLRQILKTGAKLVQFFAIFRNCV